MRICGDLVAVNSVDFSLKVYRLQANGTHSLVSEASGDVAQAWRFEFADKTIVTSVTNIKQFNVETMQPESSDIQIPNPKVAHSLAIVSY